MPATWCCGGCVCCGDSPRWALLSQRRSGMASLASHRDWQLRHCRRRLHCHGVWQEVRGTRVIGHYTHGHSSWCVPLGWRRSRRHPQGHTPAAEESERTASRSKTVAAPLDMTAARYRPFGQMVKASIKAWPVELPISRSSCAVSMSTASGGSAKGDLSARVGMQWVDYGHGACGAVCPCRVVATRGKYAAKSVTAGVPNRIIPSCPSAPTMWHSSSGPPHTHWTCTGIKI